MVLCSATTDCNGVVGGGGEEENKKQAENSQRRETYGGQSAFHRGLASEQRLVFLNVLLACCDRVQWSMVKVIMK